MSVQSIGVQRPLCFLHVPKTGGTSLTDAVARLYPQDAVLTDGGNLSVDYLSHLEGRLEGRVFIAGHAGAGVARFLQGKADMITMLRRPEDHAVSNYLHVLSDPGNGLYPSACRQSFSSYLRENPYQIFFQSGSIWLAMSQAADHDDFASLQNVGSIMTFLDTLPFLGVIERPDCCDEVLSRLLPAPQEFHLPCLNAAAARGVSAKTVAGLRAEYATLRNEPDLARFFAVEAMVYAKAKTVLARIKHDLDSSPAPARRLSFLGADRFSSSAGRLDGKTIVCPLADSRNHLVFGPYNQLPRGRHEVQFHLDFNDMDPRETGRVQLEVLARGSISLRRRWVAISPRPPRGALTLSFFNSSESNVLEFRVRSVGASVGAMTFGGATVTLSHPRRSLTFPRPRFALPTFVGGDRGGLTASARSASSSPGRPFGPWRESV